MWTVLPPVGAARAVALPTRRALLLWAARVGTAGLLASFAVAIGRPGLGEHLSLSWLSPATAACLGLVAALGTYRVVAALGAGTSALAGLMAGAAALSTLAVGSAQPSPIARWGEGPGLARAVPLDAALALGALCLALVCLPGSKALAATALAGLSGWALAIPLALAGGQPGPAPRPPVVALLADLTGIFSPLAGSSAPLVARSALFAACLSGSLLALAGALGAIDQAPKVAPLARGRSLAGALGAAGAGAAALAGTKLWAFAPLCAVAAAALAPSRRAPEGRALAKHMRQAAKALSGKALPALLDVLEAASGGAGCSLAPAAGALAELEGATSHLEAARLLQRGEEAELAGALVEASRQVGRLARGLETMARSEAARLEQLVSERVGALTSANRHLVDTGWRHRQLLERTVQAAEGERARLAADLHDGPVQRLAAIGLVLDRSLLRLERHDATGAAELVQRARQELGQEVRGLRQIMSELRPPVLDEGGLEAAIRDHLSAWSATTGIDARLAASQPPKLSPEAETVAYRVVQEALANVAKHAKATHVLVTVGPAEGGARLTVRDDGRGFRVPSQPELLRAGHFGLVIMRERVELASGRFEVTSAPLAGAEVSFWLPATGPGAPHPEARLPALAAPLP